MIEATPNPFQAAYAALMPILGELALQQFQRPQETARQLRATIDAALHQRIGELERRIATTPAPGSELTIILLEQCRGEIIRLRTFYNLLPHLGEDALRYVLGSVEIDGRFGDPVKPRNMTLLASDPGPHLPVAERIEYAVAYAVTVVQGSDPEETIVVLVPRPAVARASSSISSRFAVQVTITTNTKTAEDPWSISDLLIISPKPQ